MSSGFQKKRWNVSCTVDLAIQDQGTHLKRAWQAVPILGKTDQASGVILGGCRT